MSNNKANNKFSYFFYDYETTGIDPRRDRILQFAGIRVDQDFNIIDKPLSFYCKLSPEILPQPEACLITGITPQIANSKGVNEYEFCKKVLKEFAEPGTCRLGFNSLRFDDEFTRNLFYRNIHDPYATEWQNGNSRWDIIDLVRMTCALRPGGINWPQIDGKVSFKLENLTKANNITHESAHDALSDVYATIAVAKLIKEKQEKLFAYLFKMRNKKLALEFLQQNMGKPIVHTSRMFASEYFCTSIIVPLVMHPKNSNAVICYDLRYSPENLLKLSYQEILDIWQGKNLSKIRIALKEIHVNKSPAIAPINVLSDEILARIDFDFVIAEHYLDKILKNNELNKKLENLYKANVFPESHDPEHKLYDSFLHNDDRALLGFFHKDGAAKFKDFEKKFTDERMPELIFRLRARNFYDTLDKDEQQKWHSYCDMRLGSEELSSITADKFSSQIAKLKLEYQGDNRASNILDELQRWVYEKSNISGDL